MFFCSGRAGGRRDFVVENRVGVGGRPDTPGPVGGPEQRSMGRIAEKNAPSRRHHKPIRKPMLVAVRAAFASSKSRRPSYCYDMPSGRSIAHEKIVSLIKGNTEILGKYEVPFRLSYEGCTQSHIRFVPAEFHPKGATGVVQIREVGYFDGRLKMLQMVIPGGKSAVYDILF